MFISWWRVPVSPSFLINKRWILMLNFFRCCTLNPTASHSGEDIAADNDDDDLDEKEEDKEEKKTLKARLQAYRFHTHLHCKNKRHNLCIFNGDRSYRRPHNVPRRVGKQQWLTFPYSQCYKEICIFLLKMPHIVKRLTLRVDIPRSAITTLTFLQYLMSNWLNWCYGLSWYVLGNFATLTVLVTVNHGIH